jgi:hypothetical protein
MPIDTVQKIIGQGERKKGFTRAAFTAANVVNAEIAVHIITPYRANPAYSTTACFSVPPFAPGLRSVFRVLLIFWE